MRAKLPWSLLAISLALNLFFVGGVLYSEFSGGGGDDSVSDARIATITEELGLSENDRQDLVALRGTMRERWGVMRGSRDARRDDMVDALLDASLTRAQALSLAQQRYAKRQETIADSMVDLHAYLAGLTEEQRRGFVEMAKEPSFFRELFARGGRHR